MAKNGYLDEPLRGQEHKEWRTEARKNARLLCLRVFALSGVSYPGYGFHYGMERSAAKLVALINDFDKPFTHKDKLAFEIGYEVLEEDVAEAEAYVRTQVVA